MSQENVSNGICEPETYSRIETGKHTPVKTNMYDLAERLEIPWCYYRGEIEIGSLKVYRLYKEVRKCSNRGLREESLYWLEKMESFLDMDNPVNMQFVEFEKLVVERELKKVSEEQAYIRLEKILKMTTRLPVENKFQYYSQIELEIMVEMGKMLCLQEKYDEGITLLENIIKNQKKSRVRWEYQWSGIDFVLRILSSLYFRAEMYEKANDVEKYSMETNLKLQEVISLPHALDAIADNYEHMGKQYSKIYKKLYRQTYYVADFFKFEDIYPFAKKYYEENFDRDIIWY